MYFFFFFGIIVSRLEEGKGGWDRCRFSLLFLSFLQGIFRIEFENTGSSINLVWICIVSFDFSSWCSKTFRLDSIVYGNGSGLEFWVWSGWGPSGGKGVGNECASRWSSSIVRETWMPGCCDLWPLFRDRGWFSLRESISWEWLEDVGELLRFLCKK